MKTIVNILLACMLALVVIATASAGSIQLFANGVEMAGDTVTVAPDENGNITFTGKLFGWEDGTSYRWTLDDVCEDEFYRGNGSIGSDNTKANPCIVSKEISVTPDCEYTFMVRCVEWVESEKQGKTIAGTVQATPEPTTIAMTAIGLLAVLGFVFRRRKD